MYGRLDMGTGSLCNLTSGGEGTSGTSPSAETRIKLSESTKVSPNGFKEGYNPARHVFKKGHNLGNTYGFKKGNQLRKGHHPANEFKKGNTLGFKKDHHPTSEFKRGHTRGGRKVAPDAFTLDTLPSPGEQP